MRSVPESPAARFLVSEFGGSSPSEAMHIAVELLLARSTPDRLPVLPGHYARFQRTNPTPLFAKMRIEGALRLEGGTFRIILRDLTDDSMLSAGKLVDGQRELPMDADLPEVSAEPEGNSSTDALFESRNDLALPYYLRPRQRFTYAHELCHTLFYDLTKPIPYRPYAHQRGRADRTEEQLCNLGAGLLLMPDSLLKPHLVAAANLNACALQSLCFRFQVSLEALMVRLATCSFVDTDDTVVVLSRAVENRYTGGDRKLRVQTSIMPRRLRGQYLIPHNISVLRLGLQSLDTFVVSRARTGRRLSEPAIETLRLRDRSFTIEVVHEVVPGRTDVFVSYLRILDGDEECLIRGRPSG